MKKFKDFFQEISERREFNNDIGHHDLKSRDPLLPQPVRHLHAQIAMALNKGDTKKASELRQEIASYTFDPNTGNVDI